MDSITKTFGKNIGNGLLRTTCDDIKNIEILISDILKQNYGVDDFFIRNTVATNVERLTKDYPYEEFFRTIGSNYGVSNNFIKTLDLNEFKNLINKNLNDELGVNKINIQKFSDYSYIEILVSFKEWKSLNNGAHIDYLKDKFSNEYSNTFFGEKLTNQYLKIFDKILNNDIISNIDIKDQIYGYIKGYQNDIDDYLNDLEKIKIMNLYDVDFFAGGNILLSSKTNEQQIYICNEFVSKHKNRDDMNEFLINLTGFTLSDDIRNERIEKGALNKEQSLEFINYLLNSYLKQDIKDRLVEFKEILVKSIENNDSKNFSFNDL